MQIFKAYFCFLQFLGDEAGHAFPVTEYHNLCTFLADNVADDVHSFIHLGVVSRLLVEDITAVTYLSLIHIYQRDASLFLQVLHVLVHVRIPANAFAPILHQWQR